VRLHVKFRMEMKYEILLFSILLALSGTLQL